MARIDVLRGLRLSAQEVVIAHLGGETSLAEVGSFVLEGDAFSAEVLQNVFAIAGDNLPAGVVALLGVSDVVRLGLSLDYINAHPGCPWERARPRRSMSRICPDFADACVSCWRSFFRKTPSGPRTPPLPAPVTDVISDRAPLLAAVQRGGFMPLAAPRRDGNPRFAAPRRDAVPRPREPPGYLEELKARNYLEKQG
jgi:hypothetical protein